MLKKVGVYDSVDISIRYGNKSLFKNNARKMFEVNITQGISKCHCGISLNPSYHGIGDISTQLTNEISLLISPIFSSK